MLHFKSWYTFWLYREYLSLFLWFDELQIGNCNTLTSGCTTHVPSRHGYMVIGNTEIHQYSETVWHKAFMFVRIICLLTVLQLYNIILIWQLLQKSETLKNILYCYNDTLWTQHIWVLFTGSIYTREDCLPLRVIDHIVPPFRIGHLNRSYVTFTVVLELPWKLNFYETIWQETLIIVVIFVIVCSSPYNTVNLIRTILIEWWDFFRILWKEFVVHAAPLRVLKQISLIWTDWFPCVTDHFIP